MNKLELHFELRLDYLMVELTKFNLLVLKIWKPRLLRKGIQPTTFHLVGSPRLSNPSCDNAKSISNVCRTLHQKFTLP